jgi:F-type H+-transporting ATPase subunit gamma
MANIKELKKKIKTTKSTLKITTAMKLVSAAKMARAQQAITNSRPYANELENTIKTVSALVQNYDHNYLNENDSKKDVLLVISANKGLCGGFNSQLFKKTFAFINEHNEGDRELETIYIGKKVRELLERQMEVGKMYEFEKSEPTYPEIQAIAKELSAKFESGEVGRVFIAYNIFHSAISFTPSVKQVLPMTLDESEKEKLKEENPFDFKYDPNASEILDTLIPEAYATSVFTCQLDALAAEHGSRMSAMDSASSNCKDAIKQLTLDMNKARQAAITTELIEVVSGAESLNG